MEEIQFDTNREGEELLEFLSFYHGYRPAVWADSREGSPMTRGSSPLVIVGTPQLIPTEDRVNHPILGERKFRVTYWVQ